MIPTRRKNSEKPASFNLRQIAELVGGELVGDADIRITGVAGIKDAREGDITFVSSAKYLPYLEQTRASAVVTSPEVDSKIKPLVRTSNPSGAFTRIIAAFKPARIPKAAGVHPSAIIAPGASLGENVYVGPHAVIEDGVRIGEGSVIEANVFVGADSVIGRDVRVYPNVTIREETEIGDRVIIHSGTVVGSDGFGYETTGGVHTKIPHAGTVKIEDDVEIGANVCIDRGRFEKTLIKRGVKIDNLVQIAHNVVIGENSLLVSQCGISGSTVLGKNVVVAGQSGIVGHIEIGDEAVIGAGSGVTKSVSEKSVVLGSPAKPIAEQKKIFAALARLPELFKEFAELKKKVL